MRKRTITSGEKALTYKQVEKLLAILTNIEEDALLRLALCTGIRREDITAIEDKNIDLTEGTIKYREGKKDRIWTAYIDVDMANKISMWLNTKYKLYPSSKYLFPSHHKDKKHISGKTAYNILQRNLKKAGIPPAPFHALRSTHMKLAQMKGWSEEETCKQTGDSAETVHRHYLVPSDEEMKQTAREKKIL